MSAKDIAIVDEFISVVRYKTQINELAKEKQALENTLRVCGDNQGLIEVKINKINKKGTILLGLYHEHIISQKSKIHKNCVACSHEIAQMRSYLKNIQIRCFTR